MYGTGDTVVNKTQPNSALVELELINEGCQVMFCAVCTYITVWSRLGKGRRGGLRERFHLPVVLSEKALLRNTMGLCF